MYCQATFVSFPLNPWYVGIRCVHPVIHEVCERRMSMTVRHPKPEVRKRIDHLRRNAHCQFKIVNMNSDYIFVDLCIFDFNVD